MSNNTIALLSFPVVQGKKITAAFDGGVTLLAMAERRLGITEWLARCIPDRRDPSRIAHRQRS